MTPARILVVEDNSLNLKLVRDVLRVAGYDVIEAQSGEEGLRAAQEDRHGLRDERRQRRLRDRGRIGRVVPEDTLDVGVAGDDVVVDGGRVEHRPLARWQGRQRRERVGEVARREWVERLVDRAATPRGDP